MSNLSNAATAYRNEAELLANSGHHETAGNVYIEEVAEWQKAVDYAVSF